MGTVKRKPDGSYIYCAYGREWNSEKEMKEDPYWQKEYVKAMYREGLKTFRYGPYCAEDPELRAEVEEEDKAKEADDAMIKQYYEEHPGVLIKDIAIGIFCILISPFAMPFYLTFNYRKLNALQKETFPVAWIISLMCLIFGPTGFFIAFWFFGLYILFGRGNGLL